MRYRAEMLSDCLPLPREYDSKYSRGLVGLITGSVQYPGAGILSTSSAVATGASYVRYMGPMIAQQLILSSYPEVVCTNELTSRVHAWVIGSGYIPVRFCDDADITEEIERTRNIERILKEFTQSFVVADASAIEAFALMELDHSRRSRCVITPHIGEARRLYSALGMNKSDDDIEQNRDMCAQELAEKLHCTVLLKGSQTVVADYTGQSYTLPRATPWLATAGTGDVLAGILGAMLALNHEALERGEKKLIDIVCASVCVHSYSAALASDDKSVWDSWLNISSIKDCQVQSDSAKSARLNTSIDVSLIVSPRDDLSSNFLLSHQFSLKEMICLIPQAMSILRTYSKNSL